MKIAIVGVGAVGLCWARELHETGYGAVSLADPSPSTEAIRWAGGTGLEILADPGIAADGTQIVLICVPAAALTTSVEQVLRGIPAGAVIVDLTTADPETTAQTAHSAAAVGVRYVDAAITGAVGLTGARTPLLVAGPRLPDVDALFTAVGAPVHHLPDSTPGDAVRVKLLRSVVTKGIEALAVEVLPAARSLGVLDQLFAAMGDIDNRPFTDLLMAMVSSHPTQAKRRYTETISAAEQLEKSGYPAVLTQQVAGAFGRTVERVAEVGVPADSGFTTVLDWLDR